MNIDYRVNTNINTKEIIEVFNSVGWNKEEELIEKAFQKSFNVFAYHNNALIGLARAISDDYYYTGIYDVIIKPEYQGKKIGKEMMKIITERFKGTYIFLTYTEGNREFYKKCDFIDNKNSMWIPK